MPNIIIYPPIPNNSESKKNIPSILLTSEDITVTPTYDVIQEKIKKFVKNTDIEIIDFQGLTTYQKERAFIYGDKAYGHAIAVICISGDEPIPFGVMSADINNKKLPIIVYIENNDKARKIYADYYQFLEDTNTQICKNFSNIDSFHFKNANHVVIHEVALEKTNRLNFVDAIKKTHSIYLQQSEEKRRVRMESIPPTNDQLNEKRILFSKKGFAQVASSLEEFKSHLDKEKPTVSFFGMIYPPSETNKCEWGGELTDCNLIYGLGGSNNDKPLKDQSVMYQFAYHAKKGGCKIYGTIPFSQSFSQEKLDFSMGIESCYITPQLQERMDAFKKLSQLIIVGSTGTGTYEEIIDTLRTNPTTSIIIINDDGENTPFVTFLYENKPKYPNIAVANTQAEFKLAIENFKINLEKNSSKTEEKSKQPKSAMINSSVFFSSVIESTETESIQPKSRMGLVR